MVVVVRKESERSDGGGGLKSEKRLKMRQRE